MVKNWQPPCQKSVLALKKPIIVLMQLFVLFLPRPSRDQEHKRGLVRQPGIIRRNACAPNACAKPKKRFHMT